MKNPLLEKFTPVIVLFIFINVLVFIFKNFLLQNGFDINFFLGANTILFLLSAFGFFIQTKGANSPNINAFIRGIYLSLLMKMFVIAAAVFIYILIIGGKINKPALFTSMAIYILYTSVEVMQLMKITRKKPDA